MIEKEGNVMVKKLASYLLMAALLLSVFGQVQAANKTPTAWGIDVSEYQGKIDWDTAKKYTDFVIIRCGFGRDYVDNDDKQWRNNVEACTRLKIPFGVYIYSYATTEDAIRSECRHVLRLLKGYNPTMPVYLDLEWKQIAETCTAEQILRFATIFCDTIQAAGYTPGIYANATWWETLLTAPQYDKWERWVAQFSSQLNYNRSYNMWQHSESGTINGIQGKVDMNHWYGKKLSAECVSHSFTACIIKEPTCMETGIRRYTCTHCGISYEEIIDDVIHRFQPKVIQPTETYMGYLIFECSCGSYYVGQELPPTHHIYNDGILVFLPTPYESGWLRYYCKECGEHLLDWDIPPTPFHASICPCYDFKDMPPYEHWSHLGIDYAVLEGLFKGVSENSFNPEGAMTRAMMVTVLWRYYGCPKAESPSNFTDVEPGAWYADAVAWAQEDGVVNGVSSGKFDPMGRITREQFAAILYRASSSHWSDGYKEEMGQIPLSVLNTFPDKNAISDYARTPLSWAVYKGYITGTVIDSVLTLNPQGIVTRAQAATIINRLPK